MILQGFIEGHLLRRTFLSLHSVLMVLTVGSQLIIQRAQATSGGSPSNDEPLNSCDVPCPDCCGDSGNPGGNGGLDAAGDSLMGAMAAPDQANPATGAGSANGASAKSAAGGNAVGAAKAPLQMSMMVTGGGSILRTNPFKPPFAKPVTAGGPGRASPGGSPPARSRNPILYLSGTVSESATDLNLPGPVFGWSFKRTYDSGLLQPGTTLVEVTSSSGTRWVSEARGTYLVNTPNGPSDSTPEDPNLNIDVVVSASAVRTFNEGTPPNDYNAELVKTNANTSTETYTLTEYDTGDVYIFYGLHSTVDAKHRGRLKERTSLAYQEEGKAGITYTYGSNGLASQIVPAYPQDLSEYTIDLSYYTTGVEADRLKKIEINKGFTVIAQAEYTYKGNGSYDSDLGTDGDLVQVKVSHKDSGDTGADFSIVRYTQYRYFSLADTAEDVDGDGVDDGRDHEMKMVLEADAIQRIIDYSDSDLIDSADDLLTMADTDDVGAGASAKDLREFASRSFTYYTENLFTDNSETNGSPKCLTAWDDTNGENLESDYGGEDIDESKHPFGGTGHDTGMIRSETINGSCAACGGSTTGGIKKNYYHIKINDWDPDARPVVRLIIEDTVDADGNAQLRRILGINYSGQIVREALLTDPLNEDQDNIWCRSSIYHQLAFQLLERRMPSAHKGQVTSNATLKQFLDPFNETTESWSNDTNTVSGTSGVVYYFEYHNDFFDKPAYPSEVLVRQGAGTGSRYYLSTTEWSDHYDGSNGLEHFLVDATKVFPTKETSDTNGVETSITYTFWDSDKLVLKTRTTTQPKIATDQNGAGDGPSDPETTLVEYFDERGRLRFSKNGEGYFTYFSYHPDSGELAYTAVDIDPRDLPASADATGNDSKWVKSTDAFPAGAGNANLPERDTNLPAELEVITAREYDDLGRLTLTVNNVDPTDTAGTDGSKHYVVYDGNKTIRFPYWDGTTNKPLLPIEVAEANDAGVLTATYKIDPDQTTQTGGVPTGFTDAQNKYVAWKRYFYNAVNGQLRKILEYHDIPDSNDGSPLTNYYVTAYDYDALGRPHDDGANGPID